ncbi:hypothetical protein KCU99_g421, partial [Aureobasidium melanogenum]
MPLHYPLGKQSRNGGARLVRLWVSSLQLIVMNTFSEAAGQTDDKSWHGVPAQSLWCDKNNFENNGTRVRWWTYKPLSSVEGRDDITSVRILKRDDQPSRNSIDSSEQIIIGTANGDLQLVEVPPGSDSGVIKTYYVTNGVPVRSTSLSTETEITQDQPQHLAANLSDSRIALYQVDPTQFKIAPVSEINAIPQRQKGCRIWSTKFLDSRHLAVGSGPSVEPINIFEIRPEGIVEEPVRKIGLTGNADELDPVKASSIYPIEPLLDSNGGRNGDLFLSGGYDGIVRLHDMRSPSSFTAVYHDPTDDAAIYSLLSRGRDRVVAGASRHGLLKMFDLRMSGGSMYDYAGASDTSDSSTGDWNIFINPRDRYVNSAWRGPNSWMRRSAEGSVYNLSSPSPTSPFIFAGVENAVVEFNFSSVLDKHPDPIFLGGSAGKKGRRNNVPSYLQHKQDILNLAMYSQGTDGSREAMKLRTQRSIEETLGQDINPVAQHYKHKQHGSVATTRKGLCIQASVEGLYNGNAITCMLYSSTTETPSPEQPTWPIVSNYFSDVQANPCTLDYLDLSNGCCRHPTTPDVAAAHASVLDSRSLDTVAIRRPMYPLHPSKENDHAPIPLVKYLGYQDLSSHEWAGSVFLVAISAGPC